MHLFLHLSHFPCALSVKVAKYVALRSSKGYAIGAKFREWMDARLADQEEQAEGERGTRLLVSLHLARSRHGVRVGSSGLDYCVL